MCCWLSNPTEGVVQDFYFFWKVTTVFWKGKVLKWKSGPCAWYTGRFEVAVVLPLCELTKNLEDWNLESANAKTLAR